MPPKGVAEPLAEESLRRLGRYRVERLIGAGRSGAVFLGRDPVLGRAVALKVIPLRPGVSSGDREERLGLLGETFRHLGGLAHPGLVTVHDAGIEDEYAFLVMEYVPGRDLETTLAQGPLPATSVVTLGRDLAAALDHAHARGLVHGDLRPGSVLVQSSGAAKLADCGIASALAASRLSHAVSVWDAPAYLPPEALTGPPGPASDQYALALLLYRALTGALPFAGADAAALLEAIEHGAPQPPSAHDPGLGPAVDACFARALAREPGSRFASCVEFVENLAAALPGAAAAPLALFATQPLDAALRRELTTVAAATPLAPIAARRARRGWPWLVAAGLGTGVGLGAFALLRERPAAEPPVPALVAVAPAPALPTPPAAVAEPLQPPAATSPPEPLDEPAPRQPEPRIVAADPEPSAPTPAADIVPTEPPPSGTLRVRLTSEGPAGRLVVLLGGEEVLAERFHFGGPFAFTRQRAKGGQLELVRRVPARPATLAVRVELADRVQVIPLRAEWDEDLELTLDTRIAADRSVTATLH